VVAPVPPAPVPAPPRPVPGVAGPLTPVFEENER
jgi:hypothetical protein